MQKFASRFRHDTAVCQRRVERLRNTLDQEWALVKLADTNTSSGSITTST
jgi:hypothetical protein